MWSNRLALIPTEISCGVQGIFPRWGGDTWCHRYLSVDITDHGQAHQKYICMILVWYISRRLTTTPLSALPGCTPMQQYLLLFSVKTWLFVPLANDWRCVDAHDCIALQICQLLFMILSDSCLGRQMNTGDDSPGRIKCRPIEALAVSATHKSPSWIQR